MKYIKDNWKSFCAGWLAILLFIPAISWAEVHQDLQKKAYLAMASADGKREQGNVNDAVSLYKAAALHYRELLEKGSDLKPELIQYLITYCDGQRLQLEREIETQSTSTAALLEKKLAESQQETARIISLLEAAKQQDDLVKTYKNQVDDLAWVVSKNEDTVAKHKQESQTVREQLTQEIKERAKDRKEWASVEKHYKQRLAKEDEKLALAQKEIQNLRWINTKSEEKAYKYLEENQATRELLTQKNKEHAIQLAELKRLAAEQAVGVKQEGKKLLKVNAELADLRSKLAKAEESRMRAEQRAADQSKTTSALQATANRLQQEKKELMVRLENDIKALQDRLTEVKTTSEAQKQSATKEYGNLSAQFDKQKAELIALRNERKQSKGKLDDLENSISKQLKKKEALHAKALKDQRAIQKDLSKKQEEAIAELQLAKSEKAQIAEDNQHLKDSYRQLEERLDTADKVHKQERSQLSAEIKELKSKLADTSQFKALQDKDKDLEKAASHANELQKKLAQAQQQLKSQEQLTEAAREQAETAAKEHKQSFLDKEKGLLARLKEKDDQLQATLKELKSTLADTSHIKALQDKEKALEKATSRADELQKKLAHEKQRLQAQERLTDAERVQAETAAKEQKQTFQEKEKALLARLKEKETQAAKLDKEVSAVKEEYSQALIAITGLKETIARTKKEASDFMDKEKASQREQVEELEGKLKNYKQMEADLKKSNKAYAKISNKLVELEKELSTTRKAAAQDAEEAETAYSTLIAKHKENKAQWSTREKQLEHSLKEQADRLSKNIKAMNAAQKQYDDINEKYLGFKKEAGDTQQQAEKALEQLSTKFDLATADAKQYKGALEDSQAALTKVQAQYETTKSKVATLQAQLKEADQHLSDVKQAAAQKLKDESRARELLSAKVKEHAATVADIAERIEDQNKMLEHKKHWADELGSSETAALKNSAAQIASLQKKVAAAEEQLQAVQKEGTANKTALEAALKESNDKLALQQKQHTQSLKEKEAQWAKDLARIKSLEKQVKQSQRDKTAITKLKSELGDTETQVDTLRTRLASMEKASIRQAEDAQSTIKDLQKQMDELTRDQAEFDELKAEKGNIEEELDSVRSQLKSIEKTSSRQAKKAESTIQDLRKQVEKSTLEQSALENLKAEHEKSEKQLKSLQSQLASMEKAKDRELKDAKSDIEKLKKDLQELSIEYETLEKMSDDRAKQLNQNARQIPELEKTIKTQASKIKKLSSKAGLKEPKVEAAAEKVDAAAQKKLKALEAENVLLKNTLEKLKINTLQDPHTADPEAVKPAKIGQ